MNLICRISWAIFALGAFSAADAADGTSIEAGRQVFARHCQTCHGVTGEADLPTGPDLRGIVGRKVGSGDSGIHSRAALESELVWSRETLRRYLRDPSRTMPGTIMTGRVQDPQELEELLDYLGSL